MTKQKRKIGIATVLTVAFGGLVALSTGALLFLSLSNVLESTRNTLGMRLEALITDASQTSQSFFMPMEHQAKWLADEIVAGRVDPDDDEALKLIFDGATSILPQIAAISYQKPDGSGFFFESKTRILQRVEWRKSWQVRLNRSDTNPQTAPPDKGLWVLRPSVLDGKAISTFIYPVRTPRGDLGVVAVRVNLKPLSKSLASDATFRGYELVRFSLFNKRVVLGHPMLDTLKDIERPAITDINDPYLKVLFEAKRFPLKIVGDIHGVESFSLQTDQGQRVFALMTDESRQAGGELTIGIHFDPKAGDAEINRILTFAVIGFALLLGSLTLAFFLGRRAAAPMRQLAKAAQLVQNNKLDDIEPLPVGRVRELASAATAFNEMVVGLKERVKIRDLFGKYVPQDVAALLLSDDTTGEPRNAIATVLFLDIEGFSAISEKLAPKEVVATMNAFFSDAVGLIEKEGGMVTQFQGDAILAVFNVPAPLEGHAACAIRASLAIIESIQQQDYAGQTLNCRIGINTGSLVAGAIGAEDRLNYTVYGDAVNVAARLEQMNKQFGTRILLTRDTMGLAEEFEYKEMGDLPIRGRENPVEVFTIDGI